MNYAGMTIALDECSLALHRTPSRIFYNKLIDWPFRLDSPVAFAEPNGVLVSRRLHLGQHQ
jgi:hypothetical protein